MYFLLSLGPALGIGKSSPISSCYVEGGGRWCRQRARKTDFEKQSPRSGFHCVGYGQEGGRWERVRIHNVDRWEGAGTGPRR